MSNLYSVRDRMDAADAVKVARELLFKQAMVNLNGEWVGSLAAIPSGKAESTLNYSEIFIRDNVPTMAYLLVIGEYSAVKITGHIVRDCPEPKSPKKRIHGK